MGALRFIVDSRCLLTLQLVKPKGCPQARSGTAWLLRTVPARAEKTLRRTQIRSYKHLQVLV